MIRRRNWLAFPNFFHCFFHSLQFLRISNASRWYQMEFAGCRDAVRPLRRKMENFGSFSHNFPRSLVGARLPVGFAFASECVIQLYLTLVKGGSGRSVGGWVAMGRFARVWAGVDRRWGGQRTGWLLVRGWTSGWIETRGDGCGGWGKGESEGRGGSVVCVSAALGPSAHPLALPHSSLPRPPHPLDPRSSRSTTPAKRFAQGRRLWMCSQGLLCMCMYVYVCVRVWALARTYIRRAYVLHLTNITSIYSGLLYVPDM